MIDFFIAPLEYGFMVRALIGSVLVGVMCPLVGAYVVTRNLAFMGDALAHAVLPGMVLGFIVGFNPAIAAVPTGVSVAVLVRVISRRAGLSTDTSIGILFAAMFALGLVMLARATRATQIGVNLEDLLLGQILGISPTGIYVSLGITAIVILGLFALHHWLLFSSFDPVGSQVVGKRTNIIDYVFLVILALVIVIGIQAAGVILVMAMLVTPAATAYLLVRRFVTMMIVAAALGTLAAVAGLYISYHFNLTAGPAMTLVATGIFVLAILFRRRAPV
ncbi:MAG: metal ABC transporter permease [Dehalococcoidia bacterium]|nr:metal ABC transporter permease [Dehalococcoidia bacterium]